MVCACRSNSTCCERESTSISPRRFWLAARATGVVALLLLTAQIVFGLVLSHPHNKTTWKLSKRIFPWHDHIWVFVMAFLAAHIVSLVADPKAGVDLVGAFVPGLSQYRSAPVALGTLASGVLLVGHDPTASVAFIEWYAQVPEGRAFDEDGAGYYVFPVPASP